MFQDIFQTIDFSTYFYFAIYVSFLKALTMNKRKHMYIESYDGWKGKME